MPLGFATRRRFVRSGMRPEDGPTQCAIRRGTATRRFRQGDKILGERIVQAVGIWIGKLLSVLGGKVATGHLPQVGVSHHFGFFIGFLGGHLPSPRSIKRFANGVKPLWSRPGSIHNPGSPPASRSIFPRGQQTAGNLAQVLTGREFGLFIGFFSLIRLPRLLCMRCVADIWGPEPAGSQLNGSAVLIEPLVVKPLKSGQRRERRR